MAKIKRREMQTQGQHGEKETEALDVKPLCRPPSGH